MIIWVVKIFFVLFCCVFLPTCYLGNKVHDFKEARRGSPCHQYTQPSTRQCQNSSNMNQRASQGAVVVKNPPANAGDMRDRSSLPESGRFPWRRAWQPTPVFLPRESQTEEPGGLQSIGSHRVRHYWEIQHIAWHWMKTLHATDWGCSGIGQGRPVALGSRDLDSNLSLLITLLTVGLLVPIFSSVTIEGRCQKWNIYRLTKRNKWQKQIIYCTDKKMPLPGIGSDRASAMKTEILLVYGKWKEK